MLQAWPSTPRQSVAKLPLPLDANAPQATRVLVRPDSQWRWLHPVDGVDPAETDPGFHTAFFAPDYDDASWRIGQDKEGLAGGFGYGDDWFNGVDIGTPSEKALGKSAYFRHRFTTDRNYSKLELRCQRDDGIIIYLDGREVGRDNVGTGREAYTLPAAESVADASERTVFRIPLPGVSLSPGEHVLAISLHNPEQPSSDLRIGGITLVEVE